MTSDALAYLAGKQYGKPGGGVGVNADKLDPEFARRITALMQAAEQATGEKVSVFEGYRSPERSAQLSADYKGVPVTYGGKTYQPTPGMKGKYVAAAPMVSEHNRGMAVDVRAGPSPDEYPSGAAYEYMVAHAAEYGLRNLGAKDPAHFEIPPKEYAAVAQGTPLQPFTLPASSALAAINGAVPAATGATALAYAPTPAPVPAFRQPLADTPPVPMPGRPAALNGPATLKLPSGKMVAEGFTYTNPSSGLTYIVRDAGNGMATLEPQRSGLLDIGKEANANTIAGGIIRSKIPEAVGSAVQGLGAKAGDVAASVVSGLQDKGKEVVQSVNGLGNTFSGLGNMLTGLFGGSPPPAAANSSGSPDDRGTLIAPKPTILPVTPAATNRPNNYGTPGYSGRDVPAPPASHASGAIKTVPQPTPYVPVPPGGRPGSVPDMSGAALPSWFGNDTGPGLPPSSALTWKPAAAPPASGSSNYGLPGYSGNDVPATGALGGALGGLTLGGAALGPAAPPALPPRLYTPEVGTPPGTRLGMTGTRPAPVYRPPPPPTVRIASGKTVQVGATGTAQGGGYTYKVQPDGSIKNLTTGRITASAGR